jgi:hypothetical protein
MTTAKHPHSHAHAAHETQAELAPPDQPAGAGVVTPYDPGPCPPQGGSTSVRQMNSTTTATMTDYQYWHFKQHGHYTPLQ